MNSLKCILKSIDEYESVDFKTNISARLSKSLELYLEELEKECERAGYKKERTMRRLINERHN